MKAKFLILSLCALCSFATAQNTLTPDTTAMDSLIVSDSVYSKMTKIELTEIYLQEVARVTGILNSVAFSHNMKGDVPSTKYTERRIKSVLRSVVKHNANVIEQYFAIVPYADKKNIIDAILYLKIIQ
jgi:hypothetical protein